MSITTVPSVDWAALAPAVAPVVALLLVLVLDAIAPRPPAGPQAGRGGATGLRPGGGRGDGPGGGPGLRRVHDLVAMLGLLGSGVAIALLALNRPIGNVDRATACTPSGWFGPIQEAAQQAHASCAFVASGLTLTLQALVIVGAFVTLLLTLDGTGAQDRTPHHVLLLTAVTGAVVLAGARDLATLVVALETASLPAIGLVALRRDVRGAQAGVTLLLTAVGSLGMLLLGTALVLFATGSLYFGEIDATLTDPALPHQVRTVAALGAVLAVCGIGFKLSAVPFHLWTPDTYAGAPMPIAAFLAVVSKTAGLTAVLVLLAVGLPALGASWSPVVGVLAAITVTVGNLVALRQTVAIRLLAWSTVAQAGWVLLPFGAVAGATREAAAKAAAASVGYLIAYVVASLATFGVVVVVSRRHPDGEGHRLDAYRGLARREPGAALVLGFGLICLAGLPPGVVGLVAKLVAVRPLVNVSAWWLAGIAAVNVALGVAYYLRWAALLVTRPEGATVRSGAAMTGAAAVSGGPAGAGATADAGPLRWKLSWAEGIAVAVGGAASVALSVAPQVIAGVLPTVH